MHDVIVVGDGPGGLSAALLLGKKGKQVLVFGQDGTPMHSALLLNYLGIDEMTGSAFQAAARAQAARHGAILIDAPVTRAAAVPEGFMVTTESGDAYSARYLVLAHGPKLDLATSLGLAVDANGGIEVDRDGATAVPGLYVVGWATRPKKIQAIISAGDGAAAALGILSKDAGRDVHDFDVVEKG